jgi:hypothetical protein
MTPGHRIRVAKINILPLPEIELQSSSTSSADRTITEKYVFIFSNSAGCSEPFKNEQVGRAQLGKSYNTQE